MPNTAQKPRTPAQIHCDTLNRRRKPLIDFSKLQVPEQLKAKQDEIDNLTRQLRNLQEIVPAKEAYIKQLEDRLDKALNPQPQPPQNIKTEEIPGTPRRQRRQQVDPPTTTSAGSDAITEED